MECQNSDCRKIIEDDSKFCIFCGAPQKADLIESSSPSDQNIKPNESKAHNKWIIALLAILTTAAIAIFIKMSSWNEEHAQREITEQNLIVADQAKELNSIHDDLPAGYEGLENTESSSSGVFVDKRDNQKYGWIKIGEQVWMTENLNFDPNSKSWFYDNNPDNGKIYGRLYDWKTACAVCPEGWHLPSNLEWQKLANFVGKAKNIKPIDNKWIGLEKYLQSQSGWHKNHNGTDDFNFNALPGGRRDYYKFYDEAFYISLGSEAAWWSSTDTYSVKLEDQIAYKWGIDVQVSPAKFFRAGFTKGYGFSVRCVKDDFNAVLSQLHGIWKGSIVDSKEITPIELDFQINGGVLNGTFNILTETDQNISRGSYRIKFTENSAGKVKFIVLLTGKIDNDALIFELDLSENRLVGFLNEMRPQSEKLPITFIKQEQRLHNAITHIGVFNRFDVLNKEVHSFSSHDEIDFIKTRGTRSINGNLISNLRGLDLDCFPTLSIPLQDFSLKLKNGTFYVNEEKVESTEEGIDFTFHCIDNYRNEYRVLEAGNDGITGVTEMNISFSSKYNCIFFNLNEMNSGFHTLYKLDLNNCRITDFGKSDEFYVIRSGPYKDNILSISKSWGGDHYYVIINANGDKAYEIGDFCTSRCPYH